MIDLLKGELIRFRLWAVLAFAAHLLVLGFLSRMVDMAQQPLQVYQIFGMVYFVTGALLGLYQMGTYRRPNQWLNLLHRPLHRLRIAGALSAACALLLVLAVALPILIVAFYQDTLTARVVDLRHWLMPLASWLIAACGYVAGAYAMIANRRYSFSVAMLPNLFMFAAASGPAFIALQLVVLGYLLVLLAIAFRPDPQVPAQQPLAMLATALPVQVAAYFLLWILGFGIELGWTISGSHPLNQPVPPKGGYVEADRADGKGILAVGLEGSRDPEAQLWREQISLADVYTRYPLRNLAARNDLSNPAPLDLADEENQVLWVFSHDRMRFIGQGLLDKRPRGELGLGENQDAFPAPTLQFAAGYLFNAHAAYQYDAGQQRLFERVRLPAGEVMASPPEPAGDNILVLSDRAAYFYPGRESANGLERLRPLMRVPMPGPVGNLSRVDLVELLDGYLISFTYTWGVWAGELQQPYQQVLRVDGEGRVRSITRRPIALDLPRAYSTRIWWLSPVLRTLCLRAQELFSAPAPLRAKPEPLPSSILGLALACSLLSLLGAIWLSARQSLAPALRWAWVLWCGVLGLPALLSLWLIYPRRESPAPALSTLAPVAG